MKNIEYKCCKACGKKNNPIFIHCWACGESFHGDIQNQSINHSPGEVDSKGSLFLLLLSIPWMFIILIVTVLCALFARAYAGNSYLEVILGWVKFFTIMAGGGFVAFLPLSFYISAQPGTFGRGTKCFKKMHGRTGFGGEG